VAIGALAVGLVFLSSCSADVAETLVQCLMDRSQADLKHPLARFYCLGLGFLYLGAQRNTLFIIHLFVRSTQIVQFFLLPLMINYIL
jgi:hypothetical protein